MSAILIELLVILLLILLNGVFALSELAIVSSRKVRLQEWASKKRQGARAALDLARAPERFLSTVQIGITLVGVLAGAFGGATISRVLADQIATVPALAPYAKALGLGLVVLIITYLSLVIGELVPKQIALRDPERAATLVAAPMTMLARLAAPAVGLLTLSTGAIIRLLGISASKAPPITEDELRLLLHEGTRAGVFRRAEQDMVESVFELDDRHVSAVMTPYTEIVWLDVNDPPESILARIQSGGHSRYPVGDESLDKLLGVVHTQTLLAQVMSGAPLDLRAALRPAHFVPGNARASAVIDLLKQSRANLVLVVDEHGSIEGLLTKHDLLEAIVGTILTPGEIETPPAVRRDDGSWLLDGLMPIEDFKALCHIDRPLPGEAYNAFTTLGGFVMSRIGAIPQQGDQFTWHTLRFEVVAMDERRVAQVSVKPTAASPDTTPPDDSTGSAQPPDDPGI